MIESKDSLGDMNDRIVASPAGSVLVGGEEDAGRCTGIQGCMIYRSTGRAITGNAVDSEQLLVQFNRLIRELLRGKMTRNTFYPWEIELLLDIESCRLRDAARENILKRYQKAVQRQMEKGATAPMKLSEFLAGKR